jgi:hypothetical protein
LEALFGLLTVSLGVASWYASKSFEQKKTIALLKEQVATERQEKLDWAAKSLLRQGMAPLGSDRKPKDDTMPKAPSARIVTRGDMEARAAAEQYEPRGTTTPININANSVSPGTMKRAAEIINQ